MRRFRSPRVAGCALCIGALAPATSLAATQTVYFDTLNAATTAPALAAGDVLFLDTHVRGATGALDHSVTFSVAAGVTEFSGGATWATSTSTGPGPRLVGVNIDLFDASNNLVASDAFSGSLGGNADSEFVATALAPGIYTLRVTGTAVREATYDLALAFGGTPPAAAAGETGSLPLQGPVTPAKSVFFTTLQDTRTVATTLRNGDTLLVDTLVTTQTGALSHTVNFTPSAGAERFSGGVVWMTSSAIGVAPRLVGLNVDVFDAAGTLRASDEFSGVHPGFAHSTLTGTLGVGVHRIAVSGTGVRDAALNLSLSIIDDEGVFADGFE